MARRKWMYGDPLPVTYYLPDLKVYKTGKRALAEAALLVKRGQEVREITKFEFLRDDERWKVVYYKVFASNTQVRRNWAKKWGVK